MTGKKLRMRKIELENRGKVIIKSKKSYCNAVRCYDNAAMCYDNEGYYKKENKLL